MHLWIFILWIYEFSFYESMNFHSMNLWIFILWIYEFSFYESMKFHSMNLWIFILWIYEFSFYESMNFLSMNLWIFILWIYEVSFYESMNFHSMNLWSKSVLSRMILMMMVGGVHTDPSRLWYPGWGFRYVLAQYLKIDLNFTITFLSKKNIYI